MEHMRTLGGHPIPRFSDLLELLACYPSKIAYLDMKTFDNTQQAVCVLKHAVALANSSVLRKQLIIGVWDENVFATVQAEMPDFRVGIIAETLNDVLSPQHDAVIPAYTPTSNISLEYQVLTTQIVNVIHAAPQWESYTWKVNTPEDAQKLAAIHVDGIITDYPPTIIKAFSSNNIHLAL
jgi:glycerophosphoryl diester phosphodiesterase